MVPVKDSSICRLNLSYTLQPQPYSLLRGSQKRGIKLKTPDNAITAVAVAEGNSYIITVQSLLYALQMWGLNRAKLGDTQVNSLANIHKLGDCGKGRLWRGEYLRYISGDFHFPCKEGCMVGGGSGDLIQLIYNSTLNRHSDNNSLLLLVRSIAVLVGGGGLKLRTPRPSTSSTYFNNMTMIIIATP